MKAISTRLPSADEIAEINARHLITTPLKAADLLFVFGTRVGVGPHVAAACRLWREGFFHWAIVTGGMTRGSDRSECELISEGMIAGGVPAEVILEEHRATNTGESVIFSLPVIDAHVGLGNIRSVICLGSICTSRRYLMTLHRHWPEVEKMLVAVNHFGTPVERWYTDPLFRGRVVAEWDKIEPLKGFIVEWPD
jgi:uncharacterized SAM-binding protein YcdF (DUF218 family)